jgi:glycosyltransferase involved in cell wall biosynthesis
MAKKLQQAHVAVLMCTYNGGKYITEQLHSIAQQGCEHLHLYISDDGSTDDTLEKIAAFPREGFAAIKAFSGPRTGCADNFMAMVCNATIQADYYAFSDQDDIWEHNKLQLATEFLQEIDKEKPALYCSRSRIVNAHNQHLTLSTLNERKPSFSNALVQCIAGGNTMVMNQSARNLLLNAGKVKVKSHDWWAYQLVSGAGGEVFYHSFPSVRYRQHDHNVSGENRSLKALWLRLKLLFRGDYKEWIDMQVRALLKSYHTLTPENKAIFTLFHQSRNRWILPRIYGLSQSRIHRQTVRSHVGLMLAVLLKRV